MLVVVVVERCKIIKSLTMYVVGMTTLAKVIKASPKDEASSYSWVEQ
jgi:hypothetical protein